MRGIPNMPRLDFGNRAKVIDFREGIPGFYRPLLPLAIFMAKHYDTLENMLRSLKARIPHSNVILLDLGDENISIKLKLLDMADRFGVLEWKRSLNFREVSVLIKDRRRFPRFIYGTWFEIYLAYILQKLAEEVPTSVEIFTNVKVEFDDGTGAELDLVLLTQRDKIVVEAKSGRYYKLEKYDRLAEKLHLSAEEFFLVFPHARPSVIFGKVHAIGLPDFLTAVRKFLGMEN